MGNFLYSEIQSISLKLVKYFCVGGVAAIVDIGLFYVFADLFRFHYLLVAPCSFILATLVNYVLSIQFVFNTGVRFSKKGETSLVYLVSIVGLLVNQVVLYLSVDLLMIDLLPSKLIATGSAFIWNFTSRNNFIFKAV